MIRIHKYMSMSICIGTNAFCIVNSFQYDRSIRQ